MSIRVHRYLSKDKVVTYTFGGGSDSEIPIVIFKDDTINKVLTKVAIAIADKNGEAPPDVIPYAWYKQAPLRFEKIAGVPINLFDYTNETADTKISYKDNDLFGDIPEINVVFASDAPGPPELSKLAPYYFPDIQVKWKSNTTYDLLKKESDFLFNIWKSAGTADFADISNYVFTKIKYAGISKSGAAGATAPVSLSLLFDAIHATAATPFIQLVEDSAKIVYKVFKKHTIPADLFRDWTLYERVPKANILTIMFAVTNRKNLYARATIDAKGEIYIQYNLDSREKIAWNIIEATTKKIKSWFEKIVATKVSLHVESISLRGEFRNTNNVRLKTLANYISKLHPIYHYIKEQNAKLEVSFKRAVNYKHTVDIADIISIQIRRGIPFPEILNNLIELGMSEADAIEWIQQYESLGDAAIEPPKKRSLSYTGCIISFEEATLGYKVRIDNISSIAEISSIARWIQGTLNSARPSARGRPVAAAPLVPAVVAPPAARPVSSASSASSAASAATSSASASANSSEILREDIGDLGELNFGGALGKGNHKYFLTLLQQADPVIFKDNKNYAKQCLANNFRQPIPLTESQKAKIDATESKGAYDNSVLYGSDKDHLHHYICPRIWCPISKIPISSEQLDKSGCPASNEKPIMMYDDNYWDKNKDTKHYISFLGDGKKKTDSGFCLPCCMKKPTKPEALGECKAPNGAPPAPAAAVPAPDVGLAGVAGVVGAPVAVAKSSSKRPKESNYIISTAGQLLKDRYGVIPKDMFFYLFPDESYLNCSNTISSAPCLLRRGINHGNNSFMNSVAHILGFGDVAALVKDIAGRLDALTFISCENGLLMQSFMDPAPIIPAREQPLKKEWYKWMRRSINKKYRALIDYDHVVRHDYELSRQLAIYKAYCNFMDYLASNSSTFKNPIHLVNILSRTHSIQLAIFKRNGADSAILNCPTYSDLSELLYMTAAKSLELGIVLEDNGIYEPLEMKQMNKDGIRKFSINKFAKLKELLAACPTKEPVIPVIEKLKNLAAWSQEYLESASRFRIDTVIIRPDFRINGFITKSNIVIVAPANCLPVTILQPLCEILPIKRIVYHEDIVGQRLNVEGVLKADIEAFFRKLQHIGFGSMLPVQTNAAAAAMYTGVVTISAVNPNIAPVIRAVSDRGAALIDAQDRVDAHSRRWYQIQNAVAREILTYYESLVEPLLAKKKSERIAILMNTFHKIPQKTMVQTTLEELPLQDGKAAIAKWINSLNLESRMSIYTNPHVETGFHGKEWIFSQTAVDNGLDPVVFSADNTYSSRDKIDTQTFINAAAIGAAPGAAPPLPAMLKQSAATVESLPTKWSQVKTGFANFAIYKMKEYALDSVPKLMEYIAATMFVPFIYAELEELRFKLISKLLPNSRKLGAIFDDPNMLIAWNRQFAKKYKTYDALWDGELRGISEQNRVTKLRAVFTNQQMWTTDIDFYILAKLLDITILVIRKQQYRTGNQDAPENKNKKRGDLEDLFISSSLYVGSTPQHWETRPCLILYRMALPAIKHLEFAVIVNEAMMSLINGSELPPEIEKLIKYHISATGAGAAA